MNKTESSPNPHWTQAEWAPMVSDGIKAEFKKKGVSMKYAMGSILQAGILAATLASATSSMGQAPDTPCSNATLNGTYGALIQGTASALPFAALDLVTANGKGHFEGTGTIAYNGVVTQNVPISAKYAIKPDCSGTVSFSTGATQNLVISHS